jgi:hypothetical protein
MNKQQQRWIQPPIRLKQSANALTAGTTAEPFVLSIHKRRQPTPKTSAENTTSTRAEGGVRGTGVSK